MAVGIARQNYAKVKKNYLEYIEIYKRFNNGSTEGITTFDVFYWRFTYVIAYEDTDLNRNR